MAVYQAPNGMQTRWWNLNLICVAITTTTTTTNQLHEKPSNQDIS